MTSETISHDRTGARGVPGAEPCVLLKFGELSLKKRNRPRFVQHLHANLERLTAGLGEVRVERRGCVLAVFAEAAHDELLERCLALPGVSLVHPALRVPRSADAAVRAAVELLRGTDARTFAIRARRRDKRFPVSSGELAVLAGAAVERELGLAVDLGAPGATVHLEVDTGEVFAFTERLRGAGGLPVGSSGRAMVLLSGGIDSPVAAYRMMKRGLRCDFVHFSGRPFTGPESIYKAYALAARLDRFQGRSRLWVVPFGKAQRTIAAAGAGRLQVLAQRRLMMRVASALARRERADALVTGDSLGQVASQTLHNLSVVEAAAELPLLRPLIDRDKSEIVDEARRLGTLEVSELPDEDCCTLFASPIAATHGRLPTLERIDGRLGLEELVELLVREAELFHPRFGAAGPSGVRCAAG